ncbi:MAG: DUF6049 family protein [Actinomycetota bacterium]|nr:DUF6049 family protein [Actinomycetota bacterium]
MALVIRAVAACLPALLLLTTVVVGAQTEAPVELRLVGQPLWHRPGDALGLRFEISNQSSTTLEGFIVTVAAHSRVLNRSELHESFQGDLTFEASRITAGAFADREVAAGESVPVVIDQPIDALQSLAVAAESGVYPLTVSLFDATGSRLLDSVTTPLIYYPDPPELPLNVALLVPINALPHRSPDGAFSPDATTGSWPLEDALAEGGWLDGLVAAIEAMTGPQTSNSDATVGRSDRRRGRRVRRPPPAPDPVHTGIAPTPRLVEEIHDMATGFDKEKDGSVETVRPNSARAADARRFLDRLDELLATDGVQPVLTPYSFPDLPSLWDLHRDHVVSQIHEGETALAGAELTNVPDRSWIFPPGGRLDEDSLEELQLAKGATRSFFAQESLEPLTDPEGAGCPDAPLSFTCPITVATPIGSSEGYVLDTDLQRRVFELAVGQDVRLMLQKFFAETSMIREESPGRVGRIVQLTLPTTWTPRPWVAGFVFKGLRDAPWLDTVTPEEGLRVTREVAEPRPRRIRAQLPQLAVTPDETYFETIAEAEDELDRFASIDPPDELIQRLTRNLLIAENRLWWADDSLQTAGRSYADEAAREVEQELGKIRIEDIEEIGLTSREAPVQIVVSNDAEYPTRVNVHVSSPDLKLDRTFPETIQARAVKQVTFDVVAETSGIFVLQVVVETPEGEAITEKLISVRSTEFNEIALGLTFGALGFLILFYVTRGARRRRGAEETTEASA